MLKKFLKIRATIVIQTKTNWPAYSYVAPVSWLVSRDVKFGREELNFSEWNKIPKRKDYTKDEIMKKFLEKQCQCQFIF